MITRSLLPIFILGLCVMVLSERLSGDLWHELPAFLRSVPWHIWAGAFVCTAVSFFALGQYDDLAHRQLGSRITQTHARLSGMIAIALAQTIGFGLVSGAVCRWRMLPSLSAGRALALSAFVSVSFIVALAVLTALVCLILPAPQSTRLPALGVVLAVPILLVVLLRWPRLRLGVINMKLPSITISAGIFKWTVVDTLGAAAALWLFLPSGVEISLLHFFPIYLLALLTAVLCNTPGGVGPFELVMLGCFPQVGADALMQSVIGFRLVYYAVPACLGMIMLLRPLEATQCPELPDASAGAMANAPRSEVGVVRQNGGRIVAFNGGAAAFWPTAQTVTALFSPVLGGVRATARAVQQEAVRQGKLPVLYKCTGREAVVAREMGWSVVHVADDALLCPATFDLDIPARRGLRRKLRAAEKAGVVVSREMRLPLREMGAIDKEWLALRGTARGGTLGCFCERYVGDQWVAVARLNGNPIAFLTVFNSRQEWCIDLMRYGKDTPNGTMHALVHCALMAAQAEAVPRLSLAAIPPRRAPRNPVLHYLHAHIFRIAGGSGLSQFKSSFAPCWAPRYAAAPHSVGLALGLADIALEVHSTDQRRAGQQAMQSQIGVPVHHDMTEPSYKP